MIFDVVAQGDATGDGTTVDDAAFLQARDAAETHFFSALYTVSGQADRRGRVTIVVPPGQYLLTEANALGTLGHSGGVALGLSIRGAGRGLTRIIYAPTTDATSNYLWGNDLWADVEVSGIEFVGWPSQAVREKRDADRFPGFMQSVREANAVSKYDFRDCTWTGYWRDVFSLEGDDNNCELRWFNCRWTAAVRNVLWSHGTAPPEGSDQFLNYDFFGCDFEMRRGNGLRFDRGGNINVWGGSLISAADIADTAIASTVGAGGLAAGAATLTLADASAFPSSGEVIVGDATVVGSFEIIRYTGKTGNDLTGLLRGQRGTLDKLAAAGAAVAFAPNGGCFAWLPEQLHVSATERLLVMGTRIETRTLNSFVIDSSWNFGSIEFVSTDHVRGHVAATHTPYVFRYLNGGPTVGFRSCVLPYKHRYVWDGGGTWQTNREIAYDLCSFPDWQKPKDAFEFTGVAVTGNAGAAPACELRNCRGQLSATAYQRPWETTVNWRVQNGATVRRKVFRLTRGNNKFPSASGSEFVDLPPDSIVRRVSILLPVPARSLVTSATAGWRFTVTTNAGATTLLDTGAIADPRVEASWHSIELMHDCLTDANRRITLTANATVDQQAVADCLIEYV
jgi:hypothetical protein